MTSSVGVSAYLADSWLNTLNNVAFVVPAAYFGLFTGIPGASGTSNASATTLRVPGTFAAASGGSFGFTGLPPIWSAAVAAETLTHIAAFSGAYGDPDAQFLFSGALLVPKTVAEGDQIALGNFALSFMTLAS
ncbi:hypothetical protein AWC11_07340 [Mycobacterium interjectum]|nr:hypothetical protein AWC11_07340 [Mycobacterium interjectum]